MLPGALPCRDGRRERESPPIGRPGRLARPFGADSELARFAPREVDDVELRFPGARREEDQLPPVRRPARRGIGLLAARERACLARAVRRDEPDPRAVFIGLGIDRRHDEGGMRAIGRYLRVADELERTEIPRGWGSVAARTAAS